MPLTLASKTADQGSENYLWTLNFGPQHPATHTTLRIVLKLDGERVVEAEAQPYDVIGDRLLRPAQVGVAAAAPQA